MPEKKIIYPLAYEMLPRLKTTLYYLGFPPRWKTKLLEIFRQVKFGCKDEYGLPTKPLETMLLAWMDGVINMQSLKKFTNDEKWLTSCTPFDDESIKRLCNFVQIWCKTVFCRNRYKSMPTELEKSVADFCSTMEWTELKALQSSADVMLTMEDGTVSGDAYKALPLLAVNKLLGKDLILNGTRLTLYYAGKNELVSQSISEPRSGDKYSFVFSFSIQTTPPHRRALLLCNMSIRRWIREPWYPEKDVYPDDNIQAHIKTGSNKFSQVKIWGNYARKETGWDSVDEQCYNICNFESLPSAQEVVNAPCNFYKKDEILLPYKNGMKGFKESKIGTGISVMDKAELHDEIRNALSGLVSDKDPEALWLGRRTSIPFMKSPAEYKTPEEFRKWVKSSVETDEIFFELYGLTNDEEHKKVLSRIVEKLNADFGENSESSCMKIHIVSKDLGDMAAGLSDNSTQTQIKHSRYIEKKLGKAKGVTACFAVIPAAEHYTNMGDPKAAMRNGFAMSGRVVQFLNTFADDENKYKKKIRTAEQKAAAEKAKIEHSVYDLYRQLGIVTLIDFSKKKINPLLSSPCIGVYGMHVSTQIHNKSGKARFMPLTVKVDLQTGRTRVSCDAFSRQKLSYREANLEMAKLFWKENLEKLCTQAYYQPAKQLLLELKNEYRTPDEKALLLIAADGNTRFLWDGLSDKAIGEYDFAQDYCPRSINAGKQGSSFDMKLLGTGVRIIRFRTNNEVPDYYTAKTVNKKGREQRMCNTGVFRYGDTYWDIAPHGPDKRYSSSFTESRIDNPKKEYAEKVISEIYPLQLQQEDDAEKWVFFADALCALPLQYSFNTVLPLPLHLAKGLEEYLFDA